MGLSHSPRIVTTNLLLNLDFGNIVNYNGNDVTANSTVSNLTHTFQNNTWISFANGAVTFTRPANTSPNPKIGGVIDCTTTGSLAAPNYLYNDHTTEVWVRIDNVNPGNYDPTEAYSGVLNYRGYHAGFYYTASSMNYFIWDNTGPTLKVAASWTVGTTSASQIVQSNWTQIVVKRSGNVFTPYINGLRVGTGSTTVTNTFTSTSNTLCIGGINFSTTPGQSSFCYYPNNTISCVKMYNRALSDAEIAQNFNALRGRFGL